MAKLVSDAPVVTSTKRPHFSGMSHVSLACHDLEEAKLFYARVLGGELVHEIPGFAEYRIADMVFGLSEQSGGWTGADDEYPHYALYIDGENFTRMKDWLDGHRVPNHPYRRDRTALIYFRDPSGNLFELYCDGGYPGMESLALAPRRGGLAIDFRRLNYRWDRSHLSSAGEPPRFTGFAHASLYCTDLDQAKHFYTEVLGGELIHDVDGFAEVKVAGVIIGLTVRPGSVTARDAEYPHYAFFAEAEDFLPMVDWLRQNGVTTTEPWTRDGIKGLLYFRDPSGNLLEMYCRRIEAAAGFARGAKQGGDYAIDFAALSYSWPG